MPLLTPLTHISQNLEVLDRSTRDLHPEDSAEQVSRYLEARDDLDEAREAKGQSGARRLTLGALRGLGTGGVLAAGKATPFAMAGALPWMAVPGVGLAGAAAGLGLGAGYQVLQDATRPARVEKAQGTIRDTPGWIQRATGALRKAGRDYKKVRRAPWYGLEAGVTAGGLLGAAAGSYFGDRSGPLVKPILGWQPNMTTTQQAAAAHGGLLGVAAGGALGLLAGLLLKGRRRQQLLDEVIAHRGTADV